jgi:hypothetical protein
VQGRVPLFQEVAVVAFGFEGAVRIAAIDLDHPRCDGFQKTTVVAHDEKGAGFGPEQSLQPEDAFDVQVVGRFVHQQNVRLQHQRADDGQTFLPASGQRGGGLVCCGELAQTEGCGGAAAMFMGVQAFVDEDLREDFFNRMGSVE